MREIRFFSQSCHLILARYLMRCMVGTNTVRGRLLLLPLPTTTWLSIFPLLFLLRRYSFFPLLSWMRNHDHFLILSILLRRTTSPLSMQKLYPLLHSTKKTIKKQTLICSEFIERWILQEAQHYGVKTRIVTQDLLQCIIILDFKMRTLPTRKNSTGMCARRKKSTCPTKFNGERHL